MASSSATLGRAPLYECLVAKDAELTAKFEREMVGDWPAEGVTKQLEDAVKLLGHCSEQMLAPPGALQKGAMYASELSKWANVMPRSQLLVIHTDELSLKPQAIMDSTFDFLGLPRIQIGNETRMCVDCRLIACRASKSGTRRACALIAG